MPFLLRIAAVGLLFVFIATESNAETAFAVGRDGSGKWDWFASWDKPDRQSAVDQALQFCNEKATGCKITALVPAYSCGAISHTPDNNHYGVGVAIDDVVAERSALKNCAHNSCEITFHHCDSKETPDSPFAAKSATEIPDEALKKFFSDFDGGRQPLPPPTAQPIPSPRPAQPIPVDAAPALPIASEAGIIETRNLLYLSAGVLALLFMWLLWAVSIRTPNPVLRTYLSVAAWAGLPLLLSFSLQAKLVWGLFPNPLPPVVIAYLPPFVEMYGIVYLVLYVANRLRVWGSSLGAERVDHVFLRPPALTITIPAALALYFSQHQFKPEVEFAICALLAVAVFGVGYFIRPYQVATAGSSVVGTEPVQQPQARAPAEVRSETTAVDSVPVTTFPLVVPQTPQALQSIFPIEGIVLKLKRSQRTGAMGGIIYMLDARIDASQETLSLIAKHNLGSRLIYESEARQKHATAAQEHLAGTRGGPSVFAPASEQAKGAAGTIWKLGRAAVSAVRASLSLRITVNSLLSGVHVECKDMEELLEAEGAIREAKENLEGFLETAKTFDGREEIG